jgi:3-deoxy-D-manno-octulosonate 8-phosphate phosphatase (KDO 8-P phosphatase)
MIRVLALDIDGVLTDGRVLLDESGRESKFLCFRDIDAVFHARRQGLVLALVTGEDTPMVEVIARRLEISHVYRHAKDKHAAIRQLSRDLQVPLEEIAYVGDAPKDAPALAAVAWGLAPADADEKARAAARLVLRQGGGQGAVSEAVHLVLTEREKKTGPQGIPEDHLI